METAISQVLPNTVHRCCKWHVQRKAREKLGRIMSRDEVFEQAFYTCINDPETVDEFEENWQHMIHCFKLEDNKHLCNMRRTQHTQAPAYFRKCFFPFTSTTARPEGLNSYFKTFINPQESVWKFVQQYEVLQEMMLDCEDNHAFISEATTSPLYSRYNIECQAVTTRKKLFVAHLFLLLMAHYRCATITTPLVTNTNGAPLVRHQYCR